MGFQRVGDCSDGFKVSGLGSMGKTLPETGLASGHFWDMSSEQIQYMFHGQGSLLSMTATRICPVSACKLLEFAYRPFVTS